MKRMLPLLLAVALLFALVPGMAQSAVPFGKFSAENLRGEGPITEAVFKEADVTLVNYWATWCGPCISELPDLGNLHDLSEGRAQVVGVLLDGLDMKGEKDEAVIEVMHTLLNDADAEYPVVIPDSWLMQIGSLAVSIPTTFLIDSDGRILQTVVGSRTADQWLELIDDVLVK